MLDLVERLDVGLASVHQSWVGVSDDVGGRVGEVDDWEVGFQRVERGRDATAKYGVWELVESFELGELAFDPDRSKGDRVNDAASGFGRGAVIEPFSDRCHAELLLECSEPIEGFSMDPG